MKKVSVLASVLLVALSVAAENPQAKAKHPQSSTTVTIAGLGCTTLAGTNEFAVQSWSWGASNPADILSGGGAGAGKANISDLSVTKMFDGCSPTLFGAVVTGKHYASLTLVQEDSSGNVLLTLTLNEVLVTSWVIGGSAQSERPTESVSFTFAKVCINEPSTGNKFCFDRAKSATF